MEQRRFGTSGLSVSVLSFGTMTIGGRDRFGKMGNLGVAETAASPPSTPRTSTPSAAPKKFPAKRCRAAANEFVLVTKGFLRITPGLHDIGLPRAHITRACEASLRRLRTDELNLYICHQPDSFVAVAETMRAFDDLVTQARSATSAARIFRLAGDEGAGGVRETQPHALRLPAGQLFADRPCLQIGERFPPQGAGQAQIGVPLVRLGIVQQSRARFNEPGDVHVKPDAAFGANGSLSGALGLCDSGEFVRCQHLDDCETGRKPEHRRNLTGGERAGRFGTLRAV
jgi:hypothetical protein